MQCATALLVALALVLGSQAAQSPVCNTYVVQGGDTVNIIASNVGITPQALEDALTNCYLVPGYTSGSFLQPNQRICLPPWKDQCRYVTAAGDRADCKYYTVQQGDTLDTIGSYFGIPRQDIVAANPNLEPSILSVNSFVQLPPWSADCPAPGNSQPCRVYIAQQGDSLSQIATAFSINLGDLQSLNTDVDQSVGGTTILQPGQKVKLPPFPATCGEGTEVQKPSNCKAYLAKQGDTLSTIATMFQTTVDAIIAINPSLASGGVLSPNTQILLPPADPTTCVNPEIVSGTPSPPMPPSPPPEPPSPPLPPSPPPVESPPPVVVQSPPVAEAPPAAPAPGEAEGPAEPPSIAPSPEPEPEVPTASPPAEAPPAVPTPPSAASGLASSGMLALLALAGAVAALF